MRARLSADDLHRVPERHVSIDITTELRWFFDGPLPDAVLGWFTRGNTCGQVENRRDRYRDDDLLDVGVKRRSGTTLELKRRLCSPEVVLLDEVVGQFELWQRWSPADAVVDLAGTTAWIDVDKLVIKRRFDGAGNEVAVFDQTHGIDGDGCDVEVVAVATGQRQAWSLAFSGFGGDDGQQRSVLAAWHQLMEIPEERVTINFAGATAASYPEWLATLKSRPRAERQHTR